MTAEQRAHGDYTIGWVCALPKERTAAKAMLDEEHADLGVPLMDPNSYTLGSMSGHNVVIACLPAGQTGTESAAVTATWMASTFPNIRCGLMVGIGGGIPTHDAHDVRLGDVVVSTPDGTSPAVIQWDRGRAHPGGRVERTGFLNNPPPPLLRAIARMKSEMKSENELARLWASDLEAMATKLPELAPRYLRSDSLRDVLFKPEYLHVSPAEEGDSPLGGGSGEKACRSCDLGRTIKRRPPLRLAKVHYGSIASGNQVIKDGISRDRLNLELGGKILCVEMEAAGLMNNFPCAVIRGISDYADSHKNDDWHEHAAAMAAVVSKNLLRYVASRQLEREPTVRGLVSEGKRSESRNPF